MAKNKNEETGVILKIQKQTGCLLFVIGAAMLAFVLTDFFKSGSSIFGGQSNVVGEIAGEEIDNSELVAGVEELKVIYQGSDLDEASLREQAWNQLIQEKIIKKEHKLLGITTGPAEINDALFINPDPIVVRNFTNPENNQFDPVTLRQYIEIDMQEDEEKYKNYLNFLEIPLKESREGKKYESLVRAGLYATKIDAKYDHEKEEFKKSAIAVGLPYTMVSDSAISYDDSDLRSFLSANSDRYQQLASRDIDFVVMNVFPSAEDTLETRKAVAELTERFSKTLNDSTFIANYRSIRQFNPNFVPRGGTGLSPEIEDMLFAADSGVVSDVIYTNGVFGLYKVTGIKQDTSAVMRARHVLLPLGDDSEEKANTILADLKAGRTTFEEASKENFDGTGARAGDLGWFTKDGSTNLVPQEVKDKVFASSAGSYFVVKSNNKGYHIVNVTAGPSKKRIQFAAMEKSIVPGRESDREVERLAAEIQFKALENEDFETVVEDEGQRVRQATKINVTNPSIPGIRDAKDIARWLFSDETKVGSISDVINLQDKYLVAKCTAIREKGTASLEDNKEQIRMDYLQDKKGDELIYQINEALTSANTAEDLAKALNTTTKLVPLVNLNSPQASGIGAEPKVIGTILGLEEGKRSEPIKGVTGVYVVWGQGQVQAGEASGFNAEESKRMMNDQYKALAGQAVLDALRKSGNIVDKRYKFY